LEGYFGSRYMMELNDLWRGWGGWKAGNNDSAWQDVGDIIPFGELHRPLSASSLLGRKVKRQLAE